MASKRISDRVEHRLTIGMAELADGAGGGKRKHLDCTYPDGHRIVGPDAERQPHPPLYLSVSDQDDVIWSSEHPIWVDIPAAPDGLFYRPLPWRSVRGRDGLHRVHSGSLNWMAGQFLPKNGLELKFVVKKRKDDQSDALDPDVGSLDPHIIVEP